MRFWNCRSQKDLRRSYPSHVHVLLFVKPDPGHAIGEEPAAFVGLEPVDASSLRSARRRISDLCNTLRGCQGSPTLSGLYTPKKQV